MNSKFNDEIAALIKTNDVRIVSGEGEAGTIELYDGPRTLRSINQLLRNERCDGDRWAHADVYSHDNEYGDVWINISTGECSA